MTMVNPYIHDPGSPLALDEDRQFFVWQALAQLLNTDPHSARMQFTSGALRYSSVGQDLLDQAARILTINRVAQSSSDANRMIEVALGPDVADTATPSPTGGQYRNTPRAFQPEAQRGGWEGFAETAGHIRGKAQRRIAGLPASSPAAELPESLGRYRYRSATGIDRGGITDEAREELARLARHGYLGLNETAHKMLMDPYEYFADPTEAREGFAADLAGAQFTVEPQGEVRSTAAEALRTMRLGGFERPRTGAQDVRIHQQNLSRSGSTALLSTFDRMTMSEANATFRDMANDPTWLTGMQMLLWNAGAYGEHRPSLGVFSGFDERAFQVLLNEHTRRPELGRLENVAASMMQDAWAQRDPGSLSEYLQGDGVGDDAPIYQNVDLTAESDLRITANRIWSDLMGRGITEEEFRQYVPEVHSGETEFARAAAQRVSAMRQASQQYNGFEAFMQALEMSQGGFNFDPDEWAGAAAAAGIGSDAEMSEDNKEFVTRYLVAQFYDTFGNWQDVATAYREGFNSNRNVGAHAERYGLGTNTQGDFVQDVLNRQREIQASAKAELESGMSGEGVEEIFRTRESAEGVAMRLAQSLNENEIKGFAFAQQAREFFGMLGLGGAY